MRLFGILALLLSFPALAYNGKKCWDNVVVNDMYKLDIITGPITSTTSFISSTGDCAAIGYHSKENKEMYYVQNELELQLDIANGEGPYLTELRSIYGCSNSQKVNKSLVKNYQSIYDSQKPSVAIDSVLQTQNCKHL